MAKEAARERKRDLVFGGMARWDGLDFFGPSYMSAAYRDRKGEVKVRVEPSKVWKPRNPTLQRFLRLPIVRSVFFWGRLIVQVLGSVWALLFFAATLATLWVFVLLLEAGSGAGGTLGGVSGFFADFPVLPLLVVFFAALRFSPMGRYHGAEHKSVAAYEKHGEVTMDGAKASSRIHPRCGTNILLYITLAAVLDPLIAWPGYAVLQFILISEAWFAFGQSRPSVAVGNFLQRHFTTTEPTRHELEVAVESLGRLVRVEEERARTRPV